jgi:hypothetical protein
MDWTNDSEMRENLGWEWEEEAADMMEALATIALRPDSALLAFQLVKRHQSHNPPVANGYQAAYDNNPTRFWKLTVTAGRNVAGNLGETAANVDWQWGANENSVKNAQNAYTDPHRSFAEAAGMYYLMEGQKHNGSVMTLYRATFRDYPEQMWADINRRV